MAIRWIMKSLNLSWKDTSVVYIGDDTTDEFAFRMIATRGTAILVSDENRPSSADFRVKNTQETQKLFETIIKE